MTWQGDAAARVDGWMLPSELDWLACEASTRKRIVEVGCWRGRSTKALSLATPGIVWAIDAWDTSLDRQWGENWQLSKAEWDGVYAEFRRNLEPEYRAGKVIVLRRNDHDALEALRLQQGDGWVDMAFIDGDHREVKVRENIEDCIPLLAPRALLCGHDWNIPDVERAVRALLPEAEVMRDGMIWWTIWKGGSR